MRALILVIFIFGCPDADLVDRVEACSINHCKMTEECTVLMEDLIQCCQNCAQMNQGD